MTATLAVPAPTLSFEDAGGGAAALERPLTVLLGPVTDGLAGMIRATWPEADADAAALAADTLVRLAISHAALPNGSPEETADRVARILAPYIDAQIGPGR